MNNNKEVLNNIDILQKVCNASVDYAYYHKFTEQGGISLEWSFGNFKEITGYSPEDMENLDVIQKLFLPEDFPSIEDRVDRLLLGETVVTIQRIVCKTGKIKWIRDKATPQWDEKKERVVGYISVASEITQRKENEIRIKLSEEKFRKMYENTVMPIAMVSLDFEILSANEAYCKMLGYTETEIIGKTLSDITHKESLEENLNKQRDLRDSKIESFSIVKNFIHKDGHTVTGILTASVFNNAEGKPSFFLGKVMDITQKVEVERKFKESEGIINLALDIANAGVWRRNVETKEMFADEKMHKLLGYKYGDFNNMTDTYYNLVHPDDISQMKNLMSSYLLGEIGEYSNEFRAKHKDGSWHWLSSRAQISEWKDGKPFVVTGTLIDITNHKSIEDELLKAKLKAEESERLKSAFFANMSHEIRTPLNGLLGFTELLLLKEGLDPKSEKYLNIIQQSGFRLLQIVNDLIALSKIQANLIKINKSSVNLYNLLSEQYDFFKPEAEKKGIDLVFETYESDCFITIETDKKKLLSIIVNLVKNAIKYTFSGTVKLGFKKGDDFVEVFVEDTGIGIEKENHEIIFNRFSRLDDNKSEVIEGAGLGLSIVKAYSELLGCEIKLESKKGVGSKFYFYLPLKMNDSKDLREVKLSKTFSNTKKRQEKVLIVEDDYISQEYLKFVLNNYFEELYFAKNSIEALDILSNNPSICLILMDVRLPGIDGYEITKRIRKFNKEIVIIAQTANYSPNEKEIALSAGCNDIIAKPINKDALLKMILSYMK